MTHAPGADDGRWSRPSEPTRLQRWGARHGREIRIWSLVLVAFVVIRQVLAVVRGDATGLSWMTTLTCLLVPANAFFGALPSLEKAVARWDAEHPSSMKTRRGRPEDERRL